MAQTKSLFLKLRPELAHCVMSSAAESGLSTNNYLRRVLHLESDIVADHPQPPSTEKVFHLHLPPDLHAIWAGRQKEITALLQGFYDAL
jgi:hypothetical protein